VLIIVTRTATLTVRNTEPSRGY